MSQVPWFDRFVKTGRTNQLEYTQFRQLPKVVEQNDESWTELFFLTPQEKSLKFVFLPVKMYTIQNWTIVMRRPIPYYGIQYKDNLGRTQPFRVYTMKFSTNDSRIKMLTIRNVILYHTSPNNRNIQSRIHSFLIQESPLEILYPNSEILPILIRHLDHYYHW